ncbi:LexA family protein [Pseudomonas nitroreducens]|uniref:LexA family protein n=1 Tax=Pseudomonas nitroreducens TaxID=46680 RepID=UPI0028AFB562|nr:LexA family transcriptional regulator [Pseudomonas nitroreducens]
MKKRTLTPVEDAECQALKQIFLQKRRELGLTQSSMAEQFGMSQTAISMYLNSTNALNIRAASLFSSMLQVPVSAFSPRLAEAIDKINEANFQADYEADPTNVGLAVQPTRRAREYPLISWIAAGARAESPDNFAPGDAEDWLPSTENAGPHGYWLLVKGPSMTSATPPSFPDGTPILIKPEGFDLISGKFYIAKHRDGETTFKQYINDAGAKYLTPLNPSFRTIEIDEDWVIIGRVIDAKITGL